MQTSMVSLSQVRIARGLNVRENVSLDLDGMVSDYLAGAAEGRPGYHEPVHVREAREGDIDDVTGQPIPAGSPVVQRGHRRIGAARIITSAAEGLYPAELVAALQTVPVVWVAHRDDRAELAYIVDQSRKGLTSAELCALTIRLNRAGYSESAIIRLLGDQIASSAKTRGYAAAFAAAQGAYRVALASKDEKEIVSAKNKLESAEKTLITGVRGTLTQKYLNARHLTESDFAGYMQQLRLDDGAVGEPLLRFKLDNKRLLALVAAREIDIASGQDKQDGGAEYQRVRAEFIAQDDPTKAPAPSVKPITGKDASDMAVATRSDGAKTLLRAVATGDRDSIVSIDDALSKMERVTTAAAQVKDAPMGVSAIMSAVATGDAPDIVRAVELASGQYRDLRQSHERIVSRVLAVLKALPEGAIRSALDAVVGDIDDAGFDAALSALTTPQADDTAHAAPRKRKGK